jgi:8-oxo-dGTP pyrophosphatase MutT (NUDIX family)
MTDPVIPLGARPSARVILLDPTDRLLLLHCKDESADHRWWVMPGGGLSESESFEAAALREAREETGLDVELGPCVWTRHHVFEWEGRQFDQYERFFVARCRSSAVAPVKQDSYVTGFRWWSMDEIASSTQDFAPRRLAELLPPILAGAYPIRPLDTGA